MSDVLQLIDVDVDLVDDKKIHYIATALVDDMKPGRETVYHPAHLAEPGYLLPGVCSATFEIECTEEQPELHSDPVGLLEFIRGLDLEWRLDQDD